jgi:2-amino-4-hydroxy-6-hydroxymethyldihydropteridine diphosphokinase
MTAAPADRVVVMLGSNIEPEQSLPAAVRELASLGRVVAVSSVWQTAAIGDTTQADFCNAAVLLEPNFAPSQLLIQLHAIESRLGRIRDPQNKNAARTIDLDLVIIPGPPSTIAGKQFPDPEIADRVFLALPLQEIWPEFAFPGGRPIKDVAARLLDRDAQRLRLQKRDEISLPIPR